MITLFIIGFFSPLPLVGVGVIVHWFTSVTRIIIPRD